MRRSCQKNAADLAPRDLRCSPTTSPPRGTYERPAEAVVVRTGDPVLLNQDRESARPNRTGWAVRRENKAVRRPPVRLGHVAGED